MTDDSKLAANDTGAQADGMPLLFKDPKPLEPGMAGATGMKNSTNAGFAAATNVIPITVGEFSLTEKHYPIAFTPGDNPMPVAFVGLGQDDNLFIDEQGRWEEDNYVPAYVRRYPFVLGEDREQGKYFLCVDVASEMVTDQEPDVLFYNGTEPTEFLSQAFDFCRTYQQDAQLTEAFCRELKEKNLLTEVELRHRTQSGQDLTGRIVSINNEAFDKLSNDEFLDFRTRGMLPLIYFQLSSLSNWNRIGARWEKRRAQTGGTGNGNGASNG